MKAEHPSQPVQKQLLFPPSCSSPAPRCAGCFPHCRGERSFTSRWMLNDAAWLGSIRDQLVLVKHQNYSPVLLRATKAAQRRE